MSTDGIEALFLETHNWGKTAKFLQTLGFTLEFETDHNSGQLRHGDGLSVFVAEIPADQPPQIQVALRVADAETFQPDPVLDIVSPFTDTHYGTREMLVRDPDGRLWNLQAPGRAGSDGTPGSDGASHGTGP